MIQKLEKELSRLKESEGFLTVFYRGMGELLASGVFNFLKEKGRVRPVTTDLALEAARSMGYNECLDDLFLFKELYLADAPKAQDVARRDFGALNIAESKGDLTKEETDAIRSGNTIQYHYPEPSFLGDDSK